MGQIHTRCNSFSELNNKRGEVRHFGTVRCRIHFWLMRYKNFVNRSRFAYVIAKSLLPPFYGPDLGLPIDEAVSFFNVDIALRQKLRSSYGY